VPCRWNCPPYTNRPGASVAGRWLSLGGEEPPTAILAVAPEMVAIEVGPAEVGPAQVAPPAVTVAYRVRTGERLTRIGGGAEAVDREPIGGA